MTRRETFRKKKIWSRPGGFAPLPLCWVVSSGALRAKKSSDGAPPPAAPSQKNFFSFFWHPVRKILEIIFQENIFLILKENIFKKTFSWNISKIYFLSARFREQIFRFWRILCWPPCVSGSACAFFWVGSSRPLRGPPRGASRPSENALLPALWTVGKCVTKNPQVYPLMPRLPQATGPKCPRIFPLFNINLKFHFKLQTSNFKLQTSSSNFNFNFKFQTSSSWTGDFLVLPFSKISRKFLETFSKISRKLFL